MNNRLHKSIYGQTLDEMKEDKGTWEYKHDYIYDTCKYNNKEKQVQEYKNKFLMNRLSEMPPNVIELAYLYAINCIWYGENVTEKWVTATTQAAILEKAYRKGYYDAIEKVNRERELQAADFLAEARSCAESEQL